MIALDRLGSAAFVIHACTAPRGKRREHFEHVVEVMDDVFAATSLDGNVILEDVNAAYAALEQALRVPAWQDRERELVRLDAGWQAAVSGLGPATKLADTCRLLLNRGVRSGRIARRLNAVLCPVMASADATVTRCEAFFELTRVAAALAACRAAGGAATTYPERLDDLVPWHLDRLPTDPFKGGPFVYEHRPRSRCSTKVRCGLAGQLVRFSENLGEQGLQAQEAREAIEFGAFRRRHEPHDLPQITAALVASLRRPRQFRRRGVGP